MLSKMRLLKLVGFLAVFCVVASPAGTLASLVVFPDIYDFGNILVGQTSTTIVTVTNLGTEPVEFSPSLIGDTTTFRIESDIPSMIELGQIIDIEITFNPGGEGYFSSTLLVDGTGGTLFGGMGVPYEPTPAEAITDILDFFDTSVAGGTLVGDGPGNSAEGRKNALRNMIEATGDLINDGYTEDACDQLMDACLRCDGLTRPPEFVAGPASSILSCMILDLIDRLEGMVAQDLVSENGDLHGQAILYYNESVDKTYIQVNSWGLAVNTDYNVLLCECDEDGIAIGYYMEIGSFTANGDGKGYLDISVNANVSTNWSVVIGFFTSDGSFQVTTQEEGCSGVESVVEFLQPIVVMCFK